MASGKGSTTDVAFRELARRNGLVEADLNIDYSMGHVELMQLAAAGKAEIALLPEPFVTRVLQKNPKAKIIIDLQKEWKQAFGALEQAQGGLALRGEFIREYPQVAEALIQAYELSCRRLLLAPDAPERIAKQDFGLDAASAKDSLPRLNLRFVRAKDAQAAIRAYLEILFQADPASIGGALPDQGFYY
jgi:NitT/TauT family transport system substrate-binding protein